MKNAILVVVVGAIGVLAGFALKGTSAPEDSQPAEARVSVAELEAVEAELAELQAQAAEKDEAIARLEASNRELAAAVEAARAQQAAEEEAKALAESLTEEEAKALLAIAFGEFGEMPELLEADWKTMAGAVLSMQKHIAAFAKALEEGTELDRATQIEIAKENQKLVAFALAVNGKLPTHAVNANGEYTHPLAQANLMTEVLDQADQPLTSHQRAVLTRLGEAYEDEWADMEAGYDDNTPLLAKFLDEAELKRDFYGGFEDTLSPDQQATLFPEATRDKTMLDLFSPSLMFIGTGQPLTVSSADELEGAFMGRASSYLGLSEEELAPHRDIFATWADEVRDTLEPVRPSQAMSYTLEQGMAAGNAQLRAIETLTANLDLSDEQRQRLLEESVFFVPRLIAAEEEDGGAEASAAAEG